MKRILLILILLNFLAGEANCQSFTVDELITLAYLPSKNIDHFMHKKGFVLASSKSDSITTVASFIEKGKTNKTEAGPGRTIDISFKDGCKYLTLQTLASNEYQEGQRKLIKSGFFYDSRKDPEKETSVLFQKGNITIQASSLVKEGKITYLFNLKQRAIPSTIAYAEDLLQFDSHEFLVSFFGEQNVKKDVFFLSEKELKKCSVLFSGTRRQAVFVWEDENNLSNLTYILVTNELPTAGAKRNSPLAGDNEWRFKNGISPGMGIKDLLKINEMDFDIYGNKSDLAFMVKPDENGKIDFKKTAVMLNCNSCDGDKMFNQKVVSALDVAKANLPMQVYDVIIYPSYH